MNALGPQRVCGAHHIEQIPATTVVLPLAGVGVNQAAPKHEAGDLVVKPNRVVAHANGAWLAESRLDLCSKLVFGDALLHADLGRDASDQTSFWFGQKVIRRLTIQHDWRANFLQLGIGANCRKLRRPIPAHVGTEGFVVVPEEGVMGRGRVHAGILTPPRSPDPRQLRHHAQHLVKPP